MAKDSRKRVGILDLDIFGPSIPTLMGLNHGGEPELTNGKLPRSSCFTKLMNARRCIGALDESRDPLHVDGLPPTPKRGPGSR